MLGVSGKYRLDQRLGGGGMAEVFLGSAMGAEGFQRRVAIKRVLPGYSDNAAFAQMFIAEARISSQLVHPNIVSVMDFDRDAEGRLFLVMELVEGKDLDALVGLGPLPVPVVIYVIGEVLRGLGFAHDLPVGAGMRGIVHRDVSPHNVLLSWEGAVKVSDFGIAKARAASEATASQFIKGKPAYMSPEQANGQPLDGRSDLFATGVMLWEMLVGRRLFVAEDTRATLAAVLFGQIPRPRSLRGDVPKDVERVVMKLLERDLNARYPTAEAAIAALLECSDAPKAGRELLSATLAQRFPDARVRQSRAGGHIPTPLPAAPYPTSPASPAAAMPSIGSMRNAETRVQRSSGRLVAILVAALVGSAAAAFGIAKLVRSSKSEQVPQIAAASGSSGSSGSAAVTPDAPEAPPPLDAVTPIADAAPAPPDAKKDATSSQTAHPARYGVLDVTAFPVLTVYVDNKRHGDTPQSFKLSVGKHVVRLKNESGYDERIPITITENKTTKIDRTK
jgi:serine/threonine protein kinase